MAGIHTKSMIGIDQMKMIVRWKEILCMTQRVRTTDLEEQTERARETQTCRKRKQARRESRDHY